MVKTDCQKIEELIPFPFLRKRRWYMRTYSCSANIGIDDDSWTGSWAEAARLFQSAEREPYLDLKGLTSTTLLQITFLQTTFHVVDFVERAKTSNGTPTQP